MQENKVDEKQQKLQFLENSKAALRSLKLVFKMAKIPVSMAQRCVEAQSYLDYLEKIINLELQQVNSTPEVKKDDAKTDQTA